jgi:hypothetical protein
MKKANFHLLVLFSIAMALTAAGCKKDWTCECRTQLSDGTYLVTSTTLIEKKTKKDAEAECNAFDTTVGGVMLNDCSLK